MKFILFIFFLASFSYLNAGILDSVSLSSPMMLDINGDNIKEILITTLDGKIHAYSSNGKEYIHDKWPVSLNDELGTPPAVVYDKNGNPKIGVLGMNGKFYILDSKGNTTYSYDTESLNGSIISTGDYNNDGKEDFGFGVSKGFVYFIDQTNGVFGSHPIPSRVSSNILSVDWDEDGKKETIFSGDDGKIYVMKNGNFSRSLIPKTPKGILSTLLWYGDATGDKAPQLVYSIKDKSQHMEIIKINQSGKLNIMKKFNFKCATNILFGDFDGDGKLDAVAGDSNNMLHFLSGLQEEKNGYPRYIKELKKLDGKLKKMDIDNDGKPEILFLQNGYIEDKPFGKLIAYSLTNGMISGYPKNIGKNNGCFSISDLDNDGKLEIIVTSLKKNKFGLWETKPVIIKTNAHIPMKIIILGKELNFN